METQSANGQSYTTETAQMQLIELAQQRKKDMKVKKASTKINKIRDDLDESFEEWQKTGTIEQLEKSQLLRSRLQTVMAQELSSLGVEVELPDLPPITHGADREKKERERSRLIERIPTQEGEKKLKSARRLEKLNALLD